MTIGLTADTTAAPQQVMLGEDKQNFRAICVVCRVNDSGKAAEQLYWDRGKAQPPRAKHSEGKRRVMFGDLQTPNDGCTSHALMGLTRALQQL